MKKVDNSIGSLRPRISPSILVEKMNITSSQSAPGLNRAVERIEKNVRVREIVKENDTEDHDVAPSEDQVATVPEEVETPQRGMMQLLLDGHFKGVAGLRHLIKNHDQLTGASASMAQVSSPNGVDEFLQQLADGLRTLESSTQLTEEQVKRLGEIRASFETKVREVTDKQLSADSLREEDRVTSLLATYDELKGQIALVLSDTSSTLEPEITSDAGEQEDKTHEDTLYFLNDLRVQFAETISHLSDTPSLSLLREQPGNGQAYEKFLAQYQQLITNRVSSDPVDVTT